MAWPDPENSSRDLEGHGPVMPDTPENAPGLSIEQLRELLEQLNNDPSQLTDEQLTEARDAIQAHREQHAGQKPSKELVQALTELRDARNVIDAQQSERSELAEQHRGLLDDLAEPEPTTTQPGNDGSGGEGGTQAGSESQPAEPTGQPTETAPAEGATAAPVDEGAQAVAASGTTQPRRAPVGSFKTPPAKPAQDATLVANAVVTAAGGTPSFRQGQVISSSGEAARAMAERVRAETGTVTAGHDRLFVLHADIGYPDARRLSRDNLDENMAKIEAVTDRQALVAAGGLCAPVETLYEVPVIGSQARPIKGALAPFQAERGGIRYRMAYSAADAVNGVGVWTITDDAAVTVDGRDPQKTCYRVDCPALSEEVVESIYLCLQFSNLTSRYDPEGTAAALKMGMIAHARRAENQLLAKILSTSKLLTSAAQELGAVRWTLGEFDHALAYYRQRHRLEEGPNLTWLAPAWVKSMWRADLAYQMAAGDWIEALAVSEERINQLFRARGVNPVWHLDGGIGGTAEVQTVTVTGSPTGGSFTLTYAGQTTAAIAWNATAAAVRTALEALSNIQVNDITTAGGPLPATAVTVQFVPETPGQDFALMTASGAGLTGGSAPAVAVTTTTAPSQTTTVNGVTIPSQVYGDAAAGAEIPRFPSKIDTALWVTGDKLFLDGGTLDVGLVRDSQLNRSNSYEQFSETFEGVADRGVESLRLLFEVSPNGMSAGTVDMLA